MLFHTEYTRFQALEIIREHEYQINHRGGESASICNKCADGMWRFYSRTSNSVIAGVLEDIYGTRPVVTD